MIFLLFSLLLLFITTSAVLSEEPLFTRISTAVLLLLGISGLIPFVLSENFGIGYAHSPLEIFIFSLVLSLPAIVYRRKYLSRIFDKKSLLNYSPLVLTLVLAFLGAILLKEYYTSVRGWDAYALYDARAKFFLEGMSIKEMGAFSLYDNLNPSYYLAYPPMTSVIHTVLYSSNFRSPMIAYGLFYASFFMLTVDYLVKIRIKTIYKFAFFISIVFNPLLFGHLTIAYTNLPMSSFQFAGLVFLLKFIEKGKLKSLLFSGLFVAFSSWTRYSEPLHWAFIMTLAFILLRTKVKNVAKLSYFVGYTSIIYSTRWLWRYYVYSALKTKRLISSVLVAGIKNLESINLDKVSEVLGFVFKSFTPLMYYFAIPTLLLVLIFYRKKKIREKDIGLLTFSVLLVGIMVGGTFIFSIARNNWLQLSGSLLRASVFFIPATILLSASLLESLSKRNVKN
jgi:hypothetical protein